MMCTMGTFENFPLYLDRGLKESKMVRRKAADIVRREIKTESLPQITQNLIMKQNNSKR